MDWSLIDGIGVLNQTVKAAVEAVLAAYPVRPHPPIELRQQWYYC
jgi:hypothetical protein